ncbi:hypothetical protein G9C98_005290 [Cotesia typhae]|uniref:Large neutral amino acids transporter small subunit 2 n=1 Tax=Cotesia typhae TaxID=2053667 RepID=A0A8J5R0N7_9HYME|nr:hypothetical protein G9C98_005290 [Cotesia typhae]
MPDKVAPAEHQVLPAKAKEQSVKLKKELGLLDGVSIIVGVIVGAGIFVSPHGTMIPKSGGDYAYISDAFGPLPAFLYLWVALFILVPTGNAITALTFAIYILKPFWPDCEPNYEAVRLLAAVVTCLLTAINCYNVKWATRIQDIFTGTKIFALIVIIGAGFWHLFAIGPENLINPMGGTNTSPGYIAVAVYSGLFSYSGWNYLNFVTEELKDPYRNLPRAICISLPLITIIYVLANFSYFIVLTKQEFLTSTAVAVTFGGKLLGPMAWIMPFFVACSTFGALNGAIFASSRLFFVGARNGHLPNAIALINIRNLTPMPALIFLVSLWLPILFLVICIFLVTVPCYVKPLEVGSAIMIILSGIPVYWIFVQWQKKPKWLENASHNFNVSCAKLFMCVSEEKDD